MSDCIFCKIVAGQIPCSRVFEDELLLAFLDIGPLAEGHTLLVPKVHAATIDQITPAAAERIGRLLPRIATAVQRATLSAGLNILQNNGAAAGQVVGHVHFHFIPRRESDGLGYRWNAGQYAPGRSAVIQAAIASALSGSE